jgi:hypothetical protein
MTADVTTKGRIFSSSTYPSTPGRGVTDAMKERMWEILALVV